MALDDSRAVAVSDLRISPLLPLPSRLSPEAVDYAEIMAAHDAAVAASAPGYEDPRTQLFVMTAAYHVKRGWCCRSGCRHCPFMQEQ